MSIAFNPNALAEVVLEHEKNADDRVTFYFRFLTGEQSDLRRSLIDAASAATSLDQQNALLHRALGVNLAGWKNARDGDGNRIEFAATECLDEFLKPARTVPIVKKILTHEEVWDLLRESYRQVGLQETDKKKSLCASPSNTDCSAAPAPAAAIAPADAASANPTPSR